MTLGIVWLASRHAIHHRWRTLTIAACISVTVALPFLARLVASAFEAGLYSRAAGIPLFVGAKGSRFDLVLNGLYFRGTKSETISMADWQRIVDDGGCVAIPMNLRFTARGYPVVATGLEYRELRHLRFAAGTWPTMLGECAVGSRVAATLGLKPGGALFTDQREMYNIATPPSLKLRVVGVIAETGAPEDAAVLTDIRTAWVLEGLSHGHAARTEVPAALVLDQSERNVAISEALVSVNEITPANASSFHVHASAEMLPLSAIIVLPRDERERTLLTARLNTGRTLQAVAPAAVIDELVGYVVRVQSLVDAIAAILGAATLALVALIVVLSAQLRERELRTLRLIGAGRTAIVSLFALETVMVVAVGCALATAGCAAVWMWGFDPVKFL